MGLLLLFFCGLNPAPYAAVKKEVPATLRDYLTQEKSQLNKAIQSVKASSLPKNEVEYSLKVKNLKSILTLTKAKIETLEGFIDNQNRQRIHLSSRLKHLQQLPSASGDTSVQKRVQKIELAQQNNKFNTDLILDSLDLARVYQNLLKNEGQRLNYWHLKFGLEQKLKAVNQEKTEYKQKLNALYGKNEQEQKHSRLGPIDEAAKTLISNEYIALVHHKLTELEIQKKLLKAKITLLETSDTKTLQMITDAYSESLKQLSHLGLSLEKMQSFLSGEASLDLNHTLKKKVSDLQKATSKQQEAITEEKQIVFSELEEYQNQLKKIVSSRQSLSNYSLDSWPFILSKLSAIPSQFYNYMKTLTMKVYDSYSWLDIIPVSILWSLIGLTAAVFFMLNHFLKLVGQKQSRSRFSAYLYKGVLTLIQRNIPYFCVFVMLWSVFYSTNISYVHYELLFSLFAVWITFRVMILIARLALFERISDSTGQDVTLYYRLKWLFLFGGWATALMAFSHLLPLPLLIQDIFNRLFMLFLLTVSLVAWKSRDVVPHLLRPFLMGKKRYFRNALFIGVTLIPITLFTTAIIGLFGFVNLAWTMSRYQAYIWVVLVGYILARGLLFDALELFSEWMISSMTNGWLWIEVFLKPLDTVMRIILLSVSVFLLFQLFGWHSDSLVFLRIKQFVQYSIINIPGIHITVLSTIEFFVLLLVLVWGSKWTREFCYRCLFKNSKDPGIRNSLSVFTQYAIIILGAFIALHVLGLDFSGMSMILGGLAVGMGLGLKDFASNIIGGIMLLIERPVRKGDVITIGEYEGEVSHIGIRSMRVSSWDNTEVLIPNAETFNKPFTNWTHQDAIVRTVLPIKVSREDDPVLVQEILLDVLALIPEIVANPPVQVLMQKIDQALIEFEVRYFMNVQVHSRVEIRSKVLFAITAQFQAAGIHAPVDPLTIELKQSNERISTAEIQV